MSCPKCDPGASSKRRYFLILGGVVLLMVGLKLFAEPHRGTVESSVVPAHGER